MDFIYRKKEIATCIISPLKHLRGKFEPREGKIIFKVQMCLCTSLLGGFFVHYLKRTAQNAF